MAKVIDVTKTTDPNCHGGAMATGDPSGILLHHTGSKNEDGDQQWLSHYHDNPVSINQLVKRDGTIVQIVPNNVIAWHAGVSQLNGRGQCNAWMIGVEICNAGDGKEPYTDAQYQAVGETVAYNAARYHINDSNISSHARVALPAGRKDDPLGWDWLRFWAVVDRCLAAWPWPDIPKWNGVGYRATSTI